MFLLYMPNVSNESFTALRKIETVFYATMREQPFWADIKAAAAAGLVPPKNRI
jgi:hypothetical protein